MVDGCVTERIQADGIGTVSSSTVVVIIVVVVVVVAFCCALDLTQLDMTFEILKDFYFGRLPFLAANQSI